MRFRVSRDGTAQPVQGVHHDNVSIAGPVEGFMQSGPVSWIRISCPHKYAWQQSLAEQCVDLPAEVMFRGRDAGVSNIQWNQRTDTYPARSAWDVLKKLVVERISVAWRHFSKGRR